MPNPVKLIFQPTHFISMGFGTGLLPFAPGTFGTLAAVPLYWLMRDLLWWHYSIVVLIGLFVGVWVCDATAKALGVHDHQSIVWDEVIGFFITMMVAPVSWMWVLIGFGLFRFFDIAKPWPIKWVDQNVKGGWGIMLDDVAAGLAAAVVIAILRYSGIANWMGVV